ncbi:MAG: 1-phosphofructokinase family hexose kinase [Chloroflexota bacterium]
MIYTLTLNPAIDREYRVSEITFDSVLRATETRSDPGGKGFNVSRMVAQLGAPTTAVAFAAGKAGEWLEEQLQGLGIATNFVWVEGETRTNTTVVADHQHIKVNEAGPEICDRSIAELLQTVRSQVKPGDWWVLAGSLPPGVPSNFYAQLVGLIQSAGGMVFLDTSGEPLRQALNSQPNWIKPNEKEAADVSGTETPADALAWFVKQGLDNVVISLGKEGSMFLQGDRAIGLKPPKILEQNPIGAGDAFVGGMVYGLVNNEARGDAIRLGLVCGSLAASKPGTDFGTKEEIETLLNQL